MQEKVKKALEVLPERQRLILRTRFGIGFNTEYNLEEIGEILQLARGRVRQLELESPRRLRALGQRRGLFSRPQGPSINQFQGDTETVACSP